MINGKRWLLAVLLYLSPSHSHHHRSLNNFLSIYSISRNMNKNFSIHASIYVWPYPYNMHSLHTQLIEQRHIANALINHSAWTPAVLAQIKYVVEKAQRHTNARTHARDWFAKLKIETKPIRCAVCLIAIYNTIRLDYL